MKPTTNHSRRTKATLLVAAATLLALGELTDTGPLLLGGGSAEAIIGRPLTPMSYAGVARRTTRRAAYAGAAGGYYAPHAYYAPPVAPTAAVVTTLPAGCVPGGGAYYECGTARYAPYYAGTTLVYRPI